MDSFNRFAPLFFAALGDKRFGVCRWFEPGAGIDTATPDIAELTGDKEEWRAIIVHMEDESSMAEFAADPYNPFDFLVNSEPAAGESPVPLIRLTHILGGVPVPEVNFASELIVEKNKAPRVIYKPVSDPEAEAAYGRLAAKYEYNGKKPKEIILVALRLHNDNPVGSSKKAWENFSENTSSDFWKRNRYPSTCRFLFFETTRQGAVEREAELFRLWTSVMLLATNEFDANYLQAYRLYRFDSAINAGRLGQSMQTMVNRLAGARKNIEESIRVDIQRRLNEDSQLPEYGFNVPVLFDFSGQPAGVGEPPRFSLAAKSVQPELLRWADRRAAGEKRVQDAFHASEKILERSADKIHTIPAYSPHEIRKLDKYELRDLEQKLDDTYSELVRLMSALPREPLRQKGGAAEAAAAKVEEAIQGRVTLAQLMAGLGAMWGLLALSFLSALYFPAAREEGAFGVLAAAFGVSALVFLLVSLIVLQWKRRSLNKTLAAHSDRLKRSLGDLFVSSRQFSDYLSKIASHIRGSSYLTMFHKKSDREDLLYEARKNHLKAIETLLFRLRDWSAAFHVPVNFAEDAIEDNVHVDPLRQPADTPLYTFETGVSYERPFNRSGSLIVSPFAFVDQFQIAREGLYNDD